MILMADTGFWIALHVENDPYNPAAQAVVAGLRGTPNLVLGTTLPVLTEVFHRFKNELLPVENTSRRDAKTARHRRQLVSNFAATLLEYETVIFRAHGDEADFKIATEYAGVFGTKQLRMYDYADFHLMTLTKQLGIDAIISVDVRDIIGLKKLMHLDVEPVLLLLKDESLTQTLEHLVQRHTPSPTKAAIAAIEAQWPLSAKRPPE